MGGQLPLTDAKEQKPFRMGEVKSRVHLIHEVTKFLVPWTLITTTNTIVLDISLLRDLIVVQLLTILLGTLSLSFYFHECFGSLEEAT